MENGLHRILRLDTKVGRYKQKRKFKTTTYSNHNQPVALNLLEQKLVVEATYQLWTGDLTYIIVVIGEG